MIRPRLLSFADPKREGLGHPGAGEAPMVEAIFPEGPAHLLADSPAHGRNGFRSLCLVQLSSDSRLTLLRARRQELPESAALLAATGRRVHRLRR